MRNVYILITATPTKFGALLRYFGKMKYNHAAIALDKDLKNIYSFARSKHVNLLSGRLVKENLSRYTLKNKYAVDCVIFAVPVTQHAYKLIENYISDVYKDRNYLYNVFSVLSFPLFHGVSVYKTFSCIEFVMFILKNFTDVSVNKAVCSYKPDDLLKLLKPYRVKDGTLSDFMVQKCDNAYFAPLNCQDIKLALFTLLSLSYRLLFIRLGTHSSY